MPKVGEKVRYIRGSDVFDDLTVGKEYEVILLGSNKFGTYFVVTDDVKDEAYFYADGYYCFELVTKPQPDVHALIANIGRRLHEVEAALAPKEIGVTDLSASYPKYFKDVSDIASIDVYMTHELFGIDDPSGAIQHASKKLLLSGARTGGKSKFTDIKEARDTLSRWLEINAMEAEASE